MLYQDPDQAKGAAEAMLLVVWLDTMPAAPRKANQTLDTTTTCVFWALVRDTCWGTVDLPLFRRDLAAG